MNALEFFFLCSQVAIAVVLLAVMESSYMRELHYKRLKNTFSAETITGYNEGKASEMPAERNGDCSMDRQPVERHARAENNLDIGESGGEHLTGRTPLAEQSPENLRLGENACGKPVQFRPDVQSIFKGDNSSRAFRRRGQNK